MSIALSVNLNKIALIRNSRPGNYPSVTSHGQLCLDAGVDGLTVHPRPDQRHIRPSDVTAISELVEDYPNTEFNVEGNPFAKARGDYPGFLALVENNKVHQATLVPDDDSQATSDHGFDLKLDGEKLKPIIQKLHDAGARVSLFMDPDCDQIKLAKQIGADRIELYTGPYAEAFRNNRSNLDELFEKYSKAAETAFEVGLGLNAGHDLDRQNLPRFTSIRALKEVSIGHALTVDAIELGLIPTIKAYLNICRGKSV